jgi:hypothetical protein
MTTDWLLDGAAGLISRASAIDAALVNGTAGAALARPPGVLDQNETVSIYNGHSVS